MYTEVQKRMVYAIFERLLARKVGFKVTHDSEEGVIIHRENKVRGVSMIVVDDEGECMLSISSWNGKHNSREFFTVLEDRHLDLWVSDFEHTFRTLD